MLKQLRQRIIHALWLKYREKNQQMQQIEKALANCGVHKLLLDHFAVIDLPGPQSGIPHLKAIFDAIGYKQRGNGYLPEKQNDFIWLSEEDSDEHKASDVLPQVVIADFRLSEMPDHVRSIIEKYAKQAKPFPMSLLNTRENNLEVINAVLAYFNGRDWPLPTFNEFKTVHSFNELLAWVLVFGRQPNHFTLSVHLLDHFSTLTDFHHFITKATRLVLNDDGGLIKGSEQTGIAQGSTRGDKKHIELQGGSIDIPTGFVEFVWRFGKLKEKSIWWKDYFTGFVAQHADHVIESLYNKSNTLRT